MSTSDPNAALWRIRLDRLRVLNDAAGDSGYPYLHGNDDYRMLLTFLERFDRMGWIPPVTEERRRLLAAHDVIIHRPSSQVCFYEFCSKGARGERRPWISIFFHVHEADGVLRICGVEDTAQYERRRVMTLKRMERRIEMLLRALSKKK